MQAVTTARQRSVARCSGGLATAPSLNRQPPSDADQPSEPAVDVPFARDAARSARHAGAVLVDLMLKVDEGEDSDDDDEKLEAPSSHVGASLESASRTMVSGPTPDHSGAKGIGAGGDVPVTPDAGHTSALGGYRGHAAGVGMHEITGVNVREAGGQVVVGDVTELAQMLEQVRQDAAASEVTRQHSAAAVQPSCVLRYEQSACGGVYSLLMRLCLYKTVLTHVSWRQSAGPCHSSCGNLSGMIYVGATRSRMQDTMWTHRWMFNWKTLPTDSLTHA